MNKCRDLCISTSAHHVRYELPPLLNQSAMHGSPLLLQCLIQSLSQHHQLFLSLLLQVVDLHCRQFAPSGGEGSRVPQ